MIYDIIRSSFLLTIYPIFFYDLVNQIKKGKGTYPISFLNDHGRKQDSAGKCTKW